MLMISSSPSTDIFLLRMTVLFVLHNCASAQHCPPGTAITTCEAVLVVCAEHDGQTSRFEDMQSKLIGSGTFATVDIFDANSGTQAASRHAVLFATSNGGFSDPEQLGDRLAVYHDQGGGVVSTSGEVRTGDGAQLLNNGRKYSRCMLCWSGTLAGAGTWGRAWGLQEEWGLMQF